MPFNATRAEMRGGDGNKIKCVWILKAVHCVTTLEALPVGADATFSLWRGGGGDSSARG